MRLQNAPFNLCLLRFYTLPELTRARMIRNVCDAVALATTTPTSIFAATSCSGGTDDFNGAFDTN